MTEMSHIGQAGLQGWRAKVGERAGPAVAQRTPLSEDQVRGLVGGVFFVLSVMYVVKTVKAVAQDLRG
jgi:hypothetical protein